jgi:hypothetical protein
MCRLVGVSMSVDEKTRNRYAIFGMEISSELSNYHSGDCLICKMLAAIEFMI